jgi:hypothetical protein
MDDASLTRKICKAPTCSRPALAKDYCSRHYYQVYHHGRLTPEREKDRNPPVCMAKGCFNAPAARGYCWRHYHQIRKHGRLTPERERIYGRKGCVVEGCRGKHYGRGYCQKHYMQQWYLERKKHPHQARAGVREAT